MREPEKVKRLKAQKNELVKQQEKLKAEVLGVDNANKKMNNTIEKLRTELAQAEMEKNEEITKNSMKDEVILHMEGIITGKEIEEAIMKEDCVLKEQNFAEECSRQKTLIAEQEKTKSMLEKEITDLRKDLVEKGQENETKRRKCEKLAITSQNLVYDVLKAKNVAAERGRTISSLKKEILEKNIETKNLHQSLEDGRAETAKTLCAMAIKNAAKELEDESRFIQMEIEIEGLTANFKELQGKLDEAHLAQKESEAKMCENEARAAKKLEELGIELNEAERKKAVIDEQLDAAEKANSEVTAVNRRMKEQISMQEERISGMEDEIQSMLEACEDEKKRNEELMDYIDELKNQKEMLEEQIMMKKKKKRRVRRFFEALRRSSSCGL